MERTNHPRRHPLALSLQLALLAAAIPLPSQAQQLIVTDGSTQNASGTYNGPATGVNPFALAAANPGSTIIGTNVTAKTTQNEGHGVLADLSGRVELSDSTVSTSGRDAYGVLADDSGSVRLQTVQITTTGQSAYGLAARGDGSFITGDDVTVSTRNGTPAVLASENGRIALANSTLSVATAPGAPNYGVLANKNGAVTLTNTNVTTGSLSGATGVGAFSAGQIDMTGGAINTPVGYAFHSDGADSRIAARDVAVHSGNLGAIATNGSQIALAGGSLDIDSGVALYATGSGSRIEADNTQVALEISGVGGLIGGGLSTAAPLGAFSSAAVFADKGGQITLGSGTLIKATDIRDNSMGIAAKGAGSRIDMDGAYIDMLAADSGSPHNAYAVLAIDGGTVHLRNGATVDYGEGNPFSSAALYSTGIGSLIKADDFAVNANEIGVDVESGGNVELGEGKVTVKSLDSDTAEGLNVQGTGSKVSTVGTTIDVQQNNHRAIGVTVSYGAEAHFGQGTTIRSNGIGIDSVAHLVTAPEVRRISLDNVHVEAAVGIVTQAHTALDIRDSVIEGLEQALYVDAAYGGGDQIMMSGGRLASETTEAIRVMHGLDDTVLTTISLDGVAVESAAGKLVSSYAPTDLTVRRTALSGIVNGDSRDLQFRLSDQASLTGRILWNEEDGTQYMRLHQGWDAIIDSTSRWTLTGDSDVHSLQSTGTVAFAAPATGNFKTLTVHGNYEGGGVLALNTALGDDSSQTDRLVVHGNTAGSTSLMVNNVGGAGAATTNGIQVVQVDGTSDGTFQLDGRAVAGSYEYLLHKGGLSDPNDGDWYLRSAATAPGPDPVPDPDPTPGPTPDPSDGGPGPAPSPAPVYRPETVAYLANQAAAVGMFQHSMHDRMGEPNFAGDNDSAAGWVRVGRNQVDGRSGLGQLDAETDTSVVQIGGELARGDRGRWHVGVMGGSGQAQSHAGSNVTGYQSKGKVKGYNLGVYGTWFANAGEPAGVYVDGWLQYGRYDHRVMGDYLRDETYDADTWAASLEAGYAFALSEGGNVNLYLEPQVQAIYTDYSADDHVEANGTKVREDQAGGLTTRLGVRFYGHSADATGNRMQPFVTVNWWHESDQNAMAFDGNALKLDLPRDRQEVKAGIQARLGGGWTGWGQLGVQRGADDYRDVNGQIGINYRW